MNSPKKPTEADDRRFMKSALALASRGLGTVAPNPSVGCVIVSPEGRVVGRGWTQPGGRPHAETEALHRAGPLAAGSTAYVTLEPCSHHGETAPCADALIEARVARVVAAIEDPDPRVSGRGMRRLGDAGVEAEIGLLSAEAESLNAGFLLHRRAGRPLVTLKCATTLDGRIATRTGESRWITGESARQHGHILRKSHDAIVVGIGTALADDPELTCRLPGLSQYSPIRIIVDSRLRLPLDSALVRTARTTPTWIVTSSEIDSTRHADYVDAGVSILPVAAGDDGYPPAQAVLEAIAERGVTRVLLEGGGTLAAAWMGAGVIDRLAWFRAPSIIGGDGVSALAGFGLEAIDDIRRFTLVSAQPVGEDTLETYRIAH